MAKGITTRMLQVTLALLSEQESMDEDSRMRSACTVRQKQN